MKLSEFRGEEALDVLAELIDPATEIMADNEIKAIARAKGKGKTLKIAKVAIKEHKQAVIEILAALERKNPEEYKESINLLTLPLSLLQVLNDPDLKVLFQSQSQTGAATSSGSASENTEEQSE